MTAILDIRRFVFSDTMLRLTILQEILGTGFRLSGVLKLSLDRVATFPYMPHILNQVSKIRIASRARSLVNLHLQLPVSRLPAERLARRTRIDLAWRRGGPRDLLPRRVPDGQLHAESFSRDLLSDLRRIGCRARNRRRFVQPERRLDETRLPCGSGKKYRIAFLRRATRHERRRAAPPFSRPSPRTARACWRAAADD